MNTAGVIIILSHKRVNQRLRTLSDPKLSFFGAETQGIILFLLGMETRASHMLGKRSTQSLCMSF